MKVEYFRLKTSVVKVMFMTFMLLGLVFVLSAKAEQFQPVYSNAEPERSWQKMNASSYEGTVPDLIRQCRAQAVLDVEDGLTMEKCLVLEELAKAGKGQVISVPDEHEGQRVVFTFMQGRHNGKSVTLKNLGKELGREDRAVWFYLGNGVHAYWFTGERGVSCNNLAMVLLPPPVLPKPTMHIPLKRKKFSDVVGGSEVHVVPSVQLRNCCCDTEVVNGSVYIDEGPKIKSKGYSQTGE